MPGPGAVVFGVAIDKDRHVAVALDGVGGRLGGPLAKIAGTLR